jgi:hypothetical protein
VRKSSFFAGRIRLHHAISPSAFMCVAERCPGGVPEYYGVKGKREELDRARLTTAAYRRRAEYCALWNLKQRWCAQVVSVCVEQQQTRRGYSGKHCRLAGIPGVGVAASRHLSMKRAESGTLRAYATANARCTDRTSPATRRSGLHSINHCCKRRPRPPKRRSAPTAECAHAWCGFAFRC